MQRKLLWIISVDFDARRQLLVLYSSFVKYLKKWTRGNRKKQRIICLLAVMKPKIQLAVRSGIKG